jgi:AcrR family transcriptional regulator
MPEATRPKQRRGARRAERGEAWKRGRRRELLDAADRVVRRLGPAASMDDFAAEAKVTRVVLYRYFGDKGGLYQALAERYVVALMDELRPALAASVGPRQRLTATIDAYLSFIESHREAYTFLMHRAIREGPQAQATIADFVRGVAREVSEVLAEEIAGFGFDPAPAEVWAHGIVGMVQLSADWWLEQRPDIPRERVVRYLVTLLSNGFFGAVDEPLLERARSRP